MRAKGKRFQRRIDEAREKLDAPRYLNQLEKDYEKLESFYEEVAIAQISRTELKHKENKTREDVLAMRDLKENIDLLNLRISIVQRKIDFNFRRLKFCLPELKSMDLNMNGENPLDGIAEIMRSLHE